MQRLQQSHAEEKKQQLRSSTSSLIAPQMDEIDSGHPSLHTLRRATPEIAWPLTGERACERKSAFNMTLIKGEFEICGGRFHRPGKVIKDKKKDELREEGEAGFTHR